jgi:three-Cys-motif partner protein
LDGSAKKALNIQPPFQRLVFIEDKARRFRALLKLKASHPDRRIECFRADANALVRAICDADHWRAPTSRGRRVRAVVFLDPYGMQVEWKTLQAIRDTRAVDLLYLFPIGPVLRQAAIDLSKVDQAKEDALTRLYGGNAWRQDWYKESPQSDWLQTSPTMLRNTTKQQIESGFKARLETLFPYVSEPLPLLTTRGAQLFSLFLAVSNQAPSAIALAKRAVGSIMRASRR